MVTQRRRGLYIIDLEAPFEVPRFLPQGGTFNVGEYRVVVTITCLPVMLEHTN
jgi:hypothetical protein